MNGQRCLNGFRVRTVDTTGNVYHLLHGFNQPGQIFRFLSDESSSVDIDIVSAIFSLIDRKLLNRFCVFIFDSCGNRLSAGVDKFTYDNHECHLF
jgi:hypothetical protein